MRARGVRDVARRRVAAGPAATPARPAARPGPPGGVRRIPPLPPPLSAWTGSRDLPVPPARDVPRAVAAGAAVGDVATPAPRCWPGSGPRSAGPRRRSTVARGVPHGGRAPAAARPAADLLVRPARSTTGPPVHRCTARSCRRSLAGAAGPAGAGRPRWSCRAGLPAAWTAGRDVARGDAGRRCAGRARHRRRRRHRLRGGGRRDRARSCSTPGPDQGRRALTPRARPARVRGAGRPGRQTVPEALAPARPAPAADLDQRPSATSDIELDRVEGVHGPRTLEVVLVAG